MCQRLILIFQKPSLSELAPSLKGGCRGFKGPVPQPLWIRTTYSIVDRDYRGMGIFVKPFVPEEATQAGVCAGMRGRFLVGAARSLGPRIDTVPRPRSPPIGTDL